MKLELKHLAPYLPYKLKVLDTIRSKSKIMNTGQGSSTNWVGVKTLISYSGLGSHVYKPILMPLSDLKKEEHFLKIKSWFSSRAENGVVLSFHENETSNCITATYKMMGDDFTDFIINRDGIETTDYWIANNLIKNHFDVFGLIEKGLAIDINNLKH